MSEVIITAALNGAVTSRCHTPFVPITKEEIADEAKCCENAGAAVVHVHLRDYSGKPIISKDEFCTLVSEIRKKSKVLICLSTSSWGTDANIADRIAATEAKPDLVSFHVGSMNRGDKIFCNPVEYQDALLDACLKRNIKPEFEIFDMGQLSRAVEIYRSGGLSGPLYVQFVLGAKGGCPAEPKHLLHMIDMLPKDAVWSVAAVGKAQLPLNMMGIICGGHIRTGLEDNIYMKRDLLAKSNAELVERLVKFSIEFDRIPATPDEARGILGLIS